MLPTGSISPANECLRQIYLARRDKNPRLTIRGFAKLTGVAPGRMSELLANKRRLTHRTAAKIADRLNYSPEDKLALLAVVDEGSAPRKGQGRQPITYTELSIDEFHLIADWYHFGLLNLIQTRGFELNHRWIAQRLGITTTEVRSALDRLMRLNLIKKRDGGLVRVTGPLVTTYEIPSAALRRSHEQSIEQALASLREDAVEKRDITSITFPTRPEKLPKAKQLIKQFERKMAALLKDDNATEVYNLNVQLVPVTKKARKGRGKGDT